LELNSRSRSAPLPVFAQPATASGQSTHSSARDPHQLSSGGTACESGREKGVGFGARLLTTGYGRHFLFHATFVPLIALHKDPRAQASRTWREDVAKAIATLELQPNDPLAKRCLTIIRLLSPPPEDAVASEAHQANLPISMVPGWGAISPMLAGLNTETMSSEQLIQTL
jgi:hypothetical protein